MLALLKYGSRLPFYRLENLPESLAIPLLAPTSWEAVAGAAAVIQFTALEKLRLIFISCPVLVHFATNRVRVVEERARPGMYFQPGLANLGGIEDPRVRRQCLVGREIGLIREEIR